MNDEDLQQEENYFEVCESLWMNFLISGIFVAIGIGVFITRNFEAEGKFTDFLFIYIFFLFISVLFFVKGLSKKRLILINASGIYHNLTFICDWNNFRNAYIAQEYPNASNTSEGLSDRNFIIVEFFNPNTALGYNYKIRMTDTQNKSEYEIIDALVLYSGKQLSYEVYSI